MAFNKFQTIDAATGQERLRTALQTSTGVPDASKIVQTDSTGRLDVSLMPVGVGPDTQSLPTSENLSAGDYINIYDNVGVATARLADATNGRPAHGFVKASSVSPANALVYFEGANSDLTGLTPGVRYFLGATGNPTATVPVSPASNIHQFLGIALSATSINTDIADEILI